MRTELSPEHFALDLHLTLLEHGWSVATLSHPRVQTSFALTHLFNDPFSELFDATIALLDTSSVRWSWHEEPGERILQLKKHPSVNALLEFSCWSFQKNHTRTSLHEQDPSWTLFVAQTHWCTLVYAEIEKQRRLLREPIYAQHRATGLASKNTEPLRQWLLRNGR